jgi:DNA segregation ATPase FtsK/SpoIIIE-like protein
MWFHKYCDYLLELQVERRISESLLLQNWLKNISNIENNEYETLVLAYSRKLDSLLLANYITKSPEEEESSLPHVKNVVTNLEEETQNNLPPFQGFAIMDSENMTRMPTPQSAMGSNELNESPMELDSAQYIQSKVYRCL